MPAVAIAAAAAAAAAASRWLAHGPASARPTADGRSRGARIGRVSAEESPLVFCSWPSSSSSAHD
eukprot:7184605-Prymnesium_polylepis.1